MSDTTHSNTQDVTPLLQPRAALNLYLAIGDGDSTTFGPIQGYRMPVQSRPTSVISSVTTSPDSDLSDTEQGTDKINGVMMQLGAVNRRLLKLSDQVNNLAIHQYTLMAHTRRLLESNEKQHQMLSRRVDDLSDHLKKLTTEDTTNRAYHSGKVLTMDAIVLWEGLKINSAYLHGYLTTSNQPLNTIQVKFVLDGHVFTRRSYADDIDVFTVKVEGFGTSARSMEDLAKLWNEPLNHSYSHRFTIRNDSTTSFLPLHCECMPYHLEEHAYHDGGLLCHSRRMVQKAFIRLLEELTKKPMVEIEELPVEE
ncbi:unnamed protein product [Caenorhabditis nigoni]